MACSNGIRALLLLMVGAVSLAFVDAAAAADQLLEPGATVTPFTIMDQHDQPHQIDGSVRVIIFAADMDGGDIAKEALAENGSQRLSQVHAVYIADISGMPALIAKMFAVPAMRKRGYPVLLDRTGELTRSFPRSKGKLTIIALNGLRVQAVREVATATELQQLLATISPPA